jgi:undecaprenyl phosphate-alpha-L-ara4FN deformylase
VRLGLRIDVCTYAGLQAGVPRLLRLLDRHRVRASFFVAQGPDRSGRAIFQALRPGFLAKMRRTGAARVYGWRTLVSGTLLPARQMAALAPTMRQIVAAGHELAAHGHDHRGWQDRLSRMPDAVVRRELTAAVAAYQRVTGRRPRGFGAPGWQCTPASLRLLDELELAYASDTRGRSPFYPVVDGCALRTLQLPTSFPTLDEALGLDGVDAAGFVLAVRSLYRSHAWPVLTLHAEMEGGRFGAVADDFLSWCAADGITPMPLADMAGEIQGAGAATLPRAELASRSIPGRAGLVATAAGLDPLPWQPGADRRA